MPARTWAVAAAGGALVALASVPTASAAPRYDFVGADFVLHLSAAAASPQADIPQAIATSLGYSAVSLRKGADDLYAKCVALGAGTRLTEHGLLENDGPPAPGNRPSSIYNPTEARHTVPNLQPAPLHEPRHGGNPAVREARRLMELAEYRPDLTGVLWDARCTNGTAGTATGNNHDAAGTAGSTTTGHLDSRTGAYVGTSRAFVAGLTTPSGTVEALSSTVKVTHRPGREPVIDYRIAANGGTLAAGSGVPFEEMAEQFAGQVRENAGAVAAIGRLGLTLAAPTESTSEDHARRVVHFPFVEASAGLAGQEGGIAQGQRVRLLTVAYEGLHQGGALGRLG